MRRLTANLGLSEKRLSLALGFVAALVTPALNAQPGNGRSITVGAQSWWVSCSGSGAPTVLLEAGHNQASETWSAVQPEIARFTRVCSYDRAGLGRSPRPPAGKPRDGQALVRELHALLSALDRKERYLLVGHSLGGALVRLYAAAHPANVAGLVLVDAVHEAELVAIDSILTPAQRAAGAGMRPMSPEGIDIDAVLAEVRRLPRPIGHDLVVVARGVPLAAGEMPPDWTPQQRRRREAIRVAMQEDLARLSPSGKLVVAAGSGHFVHRDEPAVVVTAIREAVELARTRRQRD